MDKRYWLAGIAAVAVVAALGLLRQSQASVPAGAVAKVDVDVAYQALNFEQMATQAGAVIVGEVTRVSPTVWNQDGGTFWEETVTDAQGRESSNTALPYYEVELKVAEPIVDTVGVAKAAAAGRPVVLTVIGMNPAEDPDTAAAGGVLSGDGATGLAAGQSIVVFAERTRMAWRSGTRPILQLMGEPQHAYFTVASGGVIDGANLATTHGEATLDSLKHQILALRSGRATE